MAFVAMFFIGSIDAFDVVRSNTGAMCLMDTVTETSCLTVNRLRLHYGILMTGPKIGAFVLEVVCPPRKTYGRIRLLQHCRLLAAVLIRKERYG